MASGQPARSVTVIIPIHRSKGNRSWLREAVNSFYGQTDSIKVVENDGEVVESFNSAAREATTEFVLPFGADDIAHPELISRLLAPSWNADVVYPSMTLVSEDLSEFLGMHQAQPFCPYRLLHWNYITGASLIRRDSLLKIGGFRDLASLEDWDLMLRMSRAGMRLKPAPDARLFYRQVEGSRNRTHPPGLYDEIRGDASALDSLKATFYAQSTPATTYLRCQLPARHLPGMVRVEQMAGLTDDNVIFPEQHGGTAIVQFPGSQMEAGWMRVARKHGIRVLVETDDNYLAMVNAQNRRRNGWGVRIGDSQFTSAGHRSIVKHADGVIVTTNRLADTYRKVNPSVFVCPNTVDPADWLELDKPSDGVFRIGWSASKSHYGDAKLVRPGLEWASRQKNTSVFTHGFHPSLKFQHGHLPWDHDLDAYRSRMMFFDVGVAPILASAEWAACRSDVKALEYAMGGALPILSDEAPYEQWTHMENCLKAKDQRDFTRQIRWAVEHREEARQLADEARRYVLSERTTEKQIGAWEAAL